MKSSKINNLQQEIIVIGSGVAGLASACRMAAEGNSVLVLESASTYGGKIGEFAKDGFRFDKGPSLFTLPEVLDELFLDCGKNPRDYYNYLQLPIVTKYFFPDGSEVNAYANLDAFKKELVDKLDEKADKLDAFFSQIEKVYEFVYPVFLANPLKEFYKNIKGSWWDNLKILLKMEAHRSLHASNSAWFEHEKTVQLFDRFATYNGSNPYKAPATLNVIPHLEHQLGAYYVQGGMRKVVDSLFNLALDLGVRFEFNQSVEKIAIKNGMATGVDTKNQQYQGRKVFCNMDVNTAYPKLLAEQKQPRLTLKQEKSTSALVFYWGMQITDSPLDVHNVIFSGDYKEEFACLEKGELSDDPTVYIYISSKVDGKDAPANHENWFVMINVPPDSGQDWTSLKEKARKNILKKLAHQLGNSLEDKILFEEILDPVKIEKETSSFGGALYGNSSNNMFAAFLRHPHRNNQIKNLFFVGGSTHPGGGIPLCLLSAKIAVNGSKKE